MPRSRTEAAHKPRGRRLPALGLVAAALAAGLLLYRAWAAPGEPPEPKNAEIAEKASSGADVLRLVSLNLYNRPYERKARLANALETLRELKPDLVALQEVGTGWILPGDPAAYLARGLGMRLARAWHEENLGIFRTGVAILSRHPILSSEYHEFERSPFWDAKGYLVARVQAPQGVLTLVSVHLASTRDEGIRRSEWRELGRAVRALSDEGPVIVAGDFNTPPEHPAAREFVSATQAAGIWDKRADLPMLRSWTPDYRDSCASAGDPASELLDQVFVAGTPKLTLAGGLIVAPSRIPHPSDHCPVAVELRR